jgi:hypothetical protein
MRKPGTNIDTKVDKTMAFKKGQSGNAKGRPPGKTLRTKFRDAVESSLPAIFEALIESAKAGDVAAAKVLVDRLIPALRPTDEAVVVALPMPLAQAGDGVITAMAAGRLSPVQAQSVMQVLSGQRALIEQGEMLQRLEAVEVWLSEGKK